MEGERHGLQVVVVRPDDADWARRVLDAVSQLEIEAMKTDR